MSTKLDTQVQIDSDVLVSMVADRIMESDYGDESIHDRVKTEVEKRIKKKLDAAFETVTEQMLRREVEAMVAEGWVSTNQWGEPLNGSKRVTIRDRLRARLSEKDNYNSRTKSIATMATDAINAVIQQEAKDLIGEVREKCSEAVRAALVGNVENIIKAELTRRR